jgi:hypothetical protein
MFEGSRHPPGTVLTLATYPNSLPVIVGPLPPVPGDPLHYAKARRIPHDYRTYKVDELTGAWTHCRDAIERSVKRGEEVSEGYRLALSQIEEVLEVRGDFPDWMREERRRRAEPPRRLP